MKGKGKKVTNMFDKWKKAKKHKAEMQKEYQKEMDKMQAVFNQVMKNQEQLEKLK